MVNQYITNPSTLCLVCSEAITNPLCPSCVSTHILHWAEDKGERIKNLCKKAINALGQQSDRLTTNSTTTCIVCHRNHSVCPFCFTEMIVTYLRNSGIKEKDIDEFKEFFNYIGIPREFIFS